MIYKLKHIGRNPRFDREGHWADIWDIGHISRTLGRHMEHWAEIVQTYGRYWAHIRQMLGRHWADIGQALGRHWADIGQTYFL